jgi:hypothetical protein
MESSMEEVLAKGKAGRAPWGMEGVACPGRDTWAVGVSIQGESCDQNFPAETGKATTPK